jgi:secretion/DNA translocation related TadE-like protein
MRNGPGGAVSPGAHGGAAPVGVDGVVPPGSDPVACLSGDDRGSASLWVLGIGLAVVLLGLGLTSVGTASFGRQRAQVAADLGALAGARYTLAGAGVSCDRASEVVAANGAALNGCTVEGVEIVVEATVEVAPFGRARAAARAGPVTEGPVTAGPPRGAHAIPVMAGPPCEVRQGPVTAGPPRGAHESPVAPGTVLARLLSGLWARPTAPGRATARPPPVLRQAGR